MRHDVVICTCLRTITKSRNIFHETRQTWKLNLCSNKLKIGPYLIDSLHLGERDHWAALIRNADCSEQNKVAFMKNADCTWQNKVTFINRFVFSFANLGNLCDFFNNL